MMLALVQLFVAMIFGRHWHKQDSPNNYVKKTQLNELKKIKLSFEYILRAFTFCY